MLTILMGHLFAHLDTRYTIAFAEFDGEERGLEGSAALTEAVASGATPFGNVTLHAAIDVDMFGLNWPGVQTPVYFAHTAKGMEAVVEAARKALSVPDGMIRYGTAGASGGSDFASFVKAQVPTGYFVSDMGEEGLPTLPGSPATPTTPGVYPWWHLVDTWDTMTAMAGTDANLAAGFNVAAQLEVALLHAVATDPSLDLSA
jgi:Zn-dependent M28 family amino/carboxypeptidase